MGLQHGLGGNDALFPELTADLLELLAPGQIHRWEGEQRYIIRTTVRHALPAGAVQPQVDFVHQLAKVVPRLLDADGRRLHGYLGGGKVAAILGAPADDDAGDAAR